jgi:hypothetical protein
MLRTDLISELARHQLIHADSPFLRGGNAKSAGYVRRMEAENQIQFAKISRPSLGKLATLKVCCFMLVLAPLVD